MIEERVGNRIKELRGKLGISQEASLEVGKRNISIATLEKIVNVLEVSFSEFFDF